MGDDGPGIAEADLPHVFERLYVAEHSPAVQESGSGLYGREIAEKVHGELKRIGGIRPPREFVLMDRAAVGLGSVFMHLGAEVNWHNLFHDLIDDFDRHKLAARQKEAAEKAGVPAELVQKVD